ncbi:MAG TPA: ABC transporter substrate-binding protein [Pseudomonadales bacterium]
MTDCGRARRSLVTRLLGGLTLLALLFPLTVAASELTPEQQRGKEIYFGGSSPSGDPITAYFGKEGLELPGRAATCGSCHGHDGKGRPESGVMPSNITWSQLSKSYGHLHPDGLDHPPFDERSLRDFIRTGIYPGGQKGDPSMPSYKISDRDFDDLLAYMKLLGTILDPGLSEAAIRIGTLVPSNGPLGEIGRALQDVLQAYFDDVNAAGGIYGRRLELVVHDIPLVEEEAAAGLSAWLAEQVPFALVSPFTPRMDVEVQSLIASRNIPVIGPFSLYSVRSFSLNRSVFHLYSGLAEQFEALLQFADKQLQLLSPRIAVLHPDEKGLADVLAAIEQAAKKRGWPAVRREPYSAAAFDAASSVETLRDAGIDVVICLGVEPELRSFLAAAAQQGWRPWILAAGALSGGTLSDVPLGFEQRLYLSYPTLPQDREPWALREFALLVAGSEAARSHTQAAISAYSSAVVLVEALRRAGRDLGRRELTAELERFYQFETGLTPPITFTANRRIGAKGAYILDPASLEQGRLTELAPWVDLN